MYADVLANLDWLPFRQQPLRNAHKSVPSAIAIVLTPKLVPRLEAFCQVQHDVWGKSQSLNVLFEALNRDLLKYNVLPGRYYA
jgi:hypothetical protein